MATYNDVIGSLMRWKLRLSQFDYEVLYRPGLDHHLQYVLSMPPHSSCTQICKLIDDSIPTFKPSPATREQQLKEKGVICTFALDSFFKTINFLTLSHIVNRILVDEKLVDDCNANVWVIAANEPQTLDDMAVLLCILEFLKGQKYDHFYQLILATNVNDPSSGFYERNNELLTCRHPSISGLQESVIPRIV